MVKKPLRILQIIVQSNLRAGGAVQLFRLSKELVRRGHYVYALFDDDPDFRDHFTVFDGCGIDLNFLRMRRVKPDIPTIKTVKKLRSIIKKGRFNIIHAHKGNAVDLVWLATIGLDIPIVANIGAAFPVNYFQAFKYRSAGIRRILAVARAVKDVMVETGRIDPGKIEVVWGSVDTEQFRPGIQSTLREEFSVPDGIRVIGFVGNFSKRKGLQYLIEAFERLAGTYDDIVLMVVGVNERELEDFSISSGAAKSCIIACGFRKDIPNCMAAFDIYAFAGLVNEGLAGTLREAAAMGLPIVTTDVAGNAELIHDKHSGLVVPPYDAPALACALEFLLDNKDEAVRFGKNARDFVVNNMTNEVRTDKIERIYYDILAEKQL